MNKIKHPKYAIKEDVVFQHSISHKFSKNFTISLEEIDSFISLSPEVQVLHIGSANEDIFYSCNLEELRKAIDSNHFESKITDSFEEANSYVVPVDSKIWAKKGVAVSSTAEDSWYKTRTRIVEEGGGFWSQEKMEAWKNKFV